MAILFFLSISALALIAVMFLVLGILKNPDSERLNRDQQNVEIAKQRLAELKQRQIAGDVPESDAAQIKEEIERELLVDLDSSGTKDDPAASASSSKVRQWAAISVGISMPVAAGLLYLVLGEPSIIGNPSLIAPKTAEVTQGADPPPLPESFDAMIQTIEEHLKVEPDDTQGWLTLAQLYLAEKRFAEASIAFAKVRELTGDSADILVRQADALVMARNGNFSGEPEELISLALQLDPDHVSSLWLAGLAASAKEDYRTALNHWTRAEANLTDQDIRFEMRRLINEARVNLGEPPTFDQEANQLVSNGYSVRVKVTLDSSIREQVDPQDTLFIFARSIGGPAIPLAVVKRQVQDLPLEVVLDDSLSMVPNMEISNFDEISVIARISKSGAPAQSSGDFYGEFGPIQPRYSPAVSVVISEKVP